VMNEAIDRADQAALPEGTARATSEGAPRSGCGPRIRPWADLLLRIRASSLHSPPTMLQQDYIMRMISELGQLVRAAVASGEPGKEVEALQAVIHAQRQLFQEPPEIALAKTLDEQIDHLAKGEIPVVAAERVSDYSEILEQAALIYDHGGKESLAMSSRILALSALLTAVVRWPQQRSRLAPKIDRFRELVSADELSPPLQELLEDYETVQVP